MFELNTTAQRGQTPANGNINQGDFSVAKSVKHHNKILTFTHILHKGTVLLLWFCAPLDSNPD